MKNQVMALFDSSYNAKVAVQRAKENGFKLSRINIATKDGGGFDLIGTGVSFVPIAGGNGFTTPAYGIPGAGFNNATDSAMEAVSREASEGDCVVSIMVESGHDALLKQFLKNCGAHRIF